MTKRQIAIAIARITGEKVMSPTVREWTLKSTLEAELKKLQEEVR